MSTCLHLIIGLDIHWTIQLMPSSLNFGLFARICVAERVRRKTRPPPEVTRFCEVRLSNDAFSQKKRSEVIKKDQVGTVLEIMGTSRQVHIVALNLQYFCGIYGSNSPSAVAVALDFVIKYRFLLYCTIKAA